MNRRKHARPPDQVYRSSFFLLASTVTTAALGFLFWVVVARFYSPQQVGMATSLITATTLIAYLSLFGLNSTLIRFPAPETARNGQLSQSIALVAGVSCLVATGYLLGLPLYGEKLLFVRDHIAAAAGFVLFCVCAAVNQLTDSVFISARAPQYNVLVDGLLQGLVKLALPVALVGFGSVGIIGATGGGYAAAAFASLLLMRRKLGFRFDFLARGTRLREQLSFSVASYISSLLNLAPLMVTPLIVLQQLGAAAAGYYYVAFQIAGLLNAVSFSVGEAVFAEASLDPSRFSVLLRRSAAIMTAVQVPAALIVAAGAGLLLRLFGGSYAAEARPLLTVLALGALAVALNTWASFALKLTRRMGPLVFSNVVYAVVTIGLAMLWSHRGLVWLGWAWGAGNLASGLVAMAGLPGWRRGRARAAEREQPPAPVQDAVLPPWEHPPGPYPQPVPQRDAYPREQVRPERFPPEPRAEQRDPWGTTLPPRSGEAGA
ncbi:lipopolysaccharide biosynthesis protein [Kitasatospora sp. NBC_00374]|uniref:lipopolysaccharide biosynthesis protein n=1 Tax=Kitasatospora sp. NBC_00374 TaxID=2975964 RepID=UPI0030E253E5